MGPGARPLAAARRQSRVSLDRMWIGLARTAALLRDDRLSLYQLGHCRRESVVLERVISMTPQPGT